MSVSPFTADDTAMLLIDHQVGTMGWVASMPIDEMKRNAITLAKLAKAIDIPLVLTSSMEENVQGPLMAELEDIAPEEFAARIQRRGVVNAFDDEDFAAAVKATGRGNLVIAGVTNDVCTVFPTLTALQDGYDVQVVADAGGSPWKVADDLALRRMEQAGAVVTATSTLLAELAQNWTTERGSKIMALVVERMP